MAGKVWRVQDSSAQQITSPLHTAMSTDPIDLGALRSHLPVKNMAQLAPDALQWVVQHVEPVQGNLSHLFWQSMDLHTLLTLRLVCKAAKQHVDARYESLSNTGTECCVCGRLQPASLWHV